MNTITQEDYAFAVAAETEEQARERLEDLALKFRMCGMNRIEAETLAKKGIERFARFCPAAVYQRTVKFLGLPPLPEIPREYKMKLLKQLEDGNYSDELLRTEVSYIVMWSNELGFSAEETTGHLQGKPQEH